MTDDANPLTLYNSLTRTKEPFIPMNPKRVTMYNCGPTVYSYAHIGNARAAVVADVLFRVLRHIYGEEHVVYARNITDVDDKIIAAAKEGGVPISEITEKYARIYNEDLAAIGCLPPTHQPKATENINGENGMIALISDLMSKGYAYASDGHVFFDVSKYDDYGKLSGNTLENLRGGERVGEGEVARKKNSADFVLWKPELDGVGWDAPFGRGRPGWHIECSAMAKETLGETIDIHCGGVDLKFPHHENEIAQSECAHGKPMANYWVHNEFLNMGSEKMSKSIGNVKLIRDLLKDWDGEVIRLALLKAHYRSELLWSEDLLKESKSNLSKLYGLRRKLLGFPKNLDAFKLRMELGIGFLNGTILNDLDFIFTIQGMADRLGLLSSLDLPNLHELLANQDEKEELEVVEEALSGFLIACEVLGLLQKDPEEWFSGGISEADHALAADYDRVRAEAMAAKEAGDKAAMGAAFKASDAIRDTLKDKGLVLETGADGTSKLRKA